MNFDAHLKDEITIEVFNSATLFGDEFSIFKEPNHVCQIYKAIRGKHCVWIPDLEMKIIWSHNGRIEALKDWGLGRNKEQILNGTFNDNNRWDDNSLWSILSEYEMFKQLNFVKLVPPIGSMIYIKNFLSDYPYGKYCDIKGRFGYYIKDADNLPERIFHFDLLKQSLQKHFVDISEGFWGDVKRHENVVNGYLIDVRRTIWDMPIMNGKSFPINKHVKKIKSVLENEDKEILKSNIHKLTQFPHKQRKQNYQSYYIDGSYNEGSRNTVERFKRMGIADDLHDKSVVDLGCNLGSVCFESFLRGARNIVGVDYELDYIKSARRLARYNNFPINFLPMDLKSDEAKAFFKHYYWFRKQRPIVFALSLFKHIGNAQWDVLNSFDWSVCYLESNNAPESFESKQAKEIEKGIKSLHKLSKFDRLGMTKDRSPRCLWKVYKNE